MQHVPMCMGACLDRAQQRIDAAITHNPGRSVDWWAAWWAKETERQINDRERHGCL